MDIEKINLTILIPAYNAERYIERCILSVLNQAPKFNIAIIVINDGSTDRTEQIVSTLVEKHPEVTMHTIKNQGVYKARNFGLSKITGDYLWMLDADDYIAPHAFEVLNHSLEKSIIIDVFHLGYQQEIKPDFFESRLPPGMDQEIINGVEFLNRSDGRLYLWNNIYRVDYLRQNNLRFLAESISLEDSLFNLNVFIKAKSVKFINKYLYFYLLNPKSISRTKTQNHLLQQGQSSLNVHIHTKKLRDEYPLNTKSYQVLHERLNHSILGFFYSLYVEGYSIKYIESIFKIYRQEHLLPVRTTTNNIKLVVFQRIVNLKWPFIWLCKFK